MDGTEPLATTLVRLADAGATGCLHVRGGDGTARLHLRAGRLQGVALPAGLGRPLGARLLAAGLVTQGALAEAEEAQRSELQGWRLGELLVHLGAAEPAVVALHVREQLVADLRVLLAGSTVTVRFRPGDRVRGDVAAPLDVRPLLAEVGHPVPVAEQPDPEPVPEPEPETETEPAPEPATETEPAPAPAPETAPEPAAGSEPERTAEPDSAPDLPAEPEPEVEEAEREVAEAATEPVDAPSDAELAAANTRDFADAFAAFAEPVAASPAPAEVAEPAATPDPEPPAATDGRDPSWDRRDTDMAALLRELSSLGGAEPTPPAAPPPHRPAAPAATPTSIAAQRKRKGLFGRVQ